MQHIGCHTSVGSKFTIVEGSCLVCRNEGLCRCVLAVLQQLAEVFFCVALGLRKALAHITGPSMVLLVCLVQRLGAKCQTWCTHNPWLCCSNVLLLATLFLLADLLSPVMVCALQSMQNEPLSCQLVEQSQSVGWRVGEVWWTRGRVAVDVEMPCCNPLCD